MRKWKKAETLVKKKPCCGNGCHPTGLPVLLDFVMVQDLRWLKKSIPKSSSESVDVTQSNGIQILC